MAAWVFASRRRAGRECARREAPQQAPTEPLASRRRARDQSSRPEEFRRYPPRDRGRVRDPGCEGTLSAAESGCQGKARMRKSPTRLQGWLVRVAAMALALTLCKAAAFAAPTATPAPAPAPTPVVATPSDPTDVQAWLIYRSAHELTSLPAQATMTFRMGVDAQKKGDTETAVRLWRGAEELDPWSLAPRLTLISHFLSRDPSQALMEIGRLAG